MGLRVGGWASVPPPCGGVVKGGHARTASVSEGMDDDEEDPIQGIAGWGKRVLGAEKSQRGMSEKRTRQRETREESRGDVTDPGGIQEGTVPNTGREDPLPSEGWHRLCQRVCRVGGIGWNESAETMRSFLGLSPGTILSRAHRR